jgi:hypothetical protein
LHVNELEDELRRSQEITRARLLKGNGLAMIARTAAGLFLVTPGRFRLLRAAGPRPRPPRVAPRARQSRGRRAVRRRSSSSRDGPEPDEADLAPQAAGRA